MTPVGRSAPVCERLHSYCRRLQIPLATLLPVHQVQHVWQNTTVDVLLHSVDRYSTVVFCLRLSVMTDG